MRRTLTSAALASALAIGSLAAGATPASASTGFTVVASTPTTVKIADSPGHDARLAVINTGEFVDVYSSDQIVPFGTACTLSAVNPPLLGDLDNKARCPHSLSFELPLGDGNDFLWVAAFPTPGIAMGGHGDDTIWGWSAHQVILTGEWFDDSGPSGYNNVQLVQRGTVIGGSARDVIHGSTLDDHLEGGGGNDDLYGHEGQDHIAGGRGADLVNGQQGRDWLYPNVMGGNTRPTADDGAMDTLHCNPDFNQEHLVIGVRGQDRNEGCTGVTWV